jgi:hypothetical protein
LTRINDALLGLVALEHRVDSILGWINTDFRPLVNITQLFATLTPTRNPVLRGDSPQEKPNWPQHYAANGKLYQAEYQDASQDPLGNTKTYGVVRGEFQVRSDVPAHLRKGIFAETNRYPVWIRFSGPGPLSPPDVADAGILSIGIKLMGVAGQKLLDDERETQDFLGISSPTFTTPNVRRT